jgi:Flp pilus assembly pilin Flp
MHTAPSPTGSRPTTNQTAPPTPSPTPHLPSALAEVVALPSAASSLPLHPSVAQTVAAAAAAQHPAFAGTTGPRPLSAHIAVAGALASRDGARHLASIDPVPASEDADSATSMLDDEDGSVLTEYGLLIVVAATVAGVLIQWAGGSQITGLFNALLRAARDTVGA